MPKKLGENTKAVEARERKQAAKKAAQDKAAKEAEDRLWKDDDKQLAKKKSRKEEEERRKNEQLRRKAESKALLEQEMASIKTNAKQPIHKVTRQQIQQEVEQRNKNIEVINAPKVAPKVTVQDPLEENLNRVMADTVIATNVDEAIAALRYSLFIKLISILLVTSLTSLYPLVFLTPAMINILRSACEPHSKLSRPRTCHASRRRILHFDCPSGNRSL